MKKFLLKIKNYIINHLPTRRRIIQIYTALLYNCNIKGFASGQIYTGNTKYMCVPGLNCYSCPGSVGACPLGALQNAMSSSPTRTPYYILGIIALFGLILGRTICGFLCPMGLIQELFHKIKTPKLKKNSVTRVFSYFKYVVLFALVFSVPIAYALNLPVPAFCKYICPSGTLIGAISLLANPNNSSMFGMLGGLFTWKFALLVIILVSSVFIYRSFCRFLCPLGAIYGFFSKIALLGVKLDDQKCIDCGICINTCKVDIKKVGDHECIQCGACIKVCPTKAISWKGSSFFLKGVDNSTIKDEKPLESLINNQNQVENIDCQDVSLTQKTSRAETTQNINQICGNAPHARITSVKTARRNKWIEGIAWGLAVLFLGGAITYYNFILEPDVTMSLNLGMPCPDFTVELYDDAQGEYSPEDSLGQVTIINFWATYCGPCIQELPYFEQINQTYGDQVKVVIIHTEDAYNSPEGTDGVKKFIDERWGDYTVTFAQDIAQNETTAYKILGGKGPVPMTVILDKDGKVKYAAEGSVTYDKLNDIIYPLLANQSITKSP